MQYEKLMSCVLILLSCCLASVHAQTIYFKEKSGIQSQYETESIQKITFFTEGNITVVKTDGTDEVYAIRDLNHISFSGINTSIRSPRKYKNTDVTLFPNPAYSHVIFKASDGKKINGTIQILSLTGRSVLLQNVSDEVEVFMNVSNLENGVYLCRYRSANKMQTVKLIKQ